MRRSLRMNLILTNNTDRAIEGIGMGMANMSPRTLIAQPSERSPRTFFSPGVTGLTPRSPDSSAFARIGSEFRFPPSDGLAIVSTGDHRQEVTFGAVAESSADHDRAPNDAGGESSDSAATVLWVDSLVTNAIENRSPVLGANGESSAFGVQIATTTTLACQDRSQSPFELPARTDLRDQCEEMNVFWVDSESPISSQISSASVSATEVPDS